MLNSGGQHVGVQLITRHWVRWDATVNAEPNSTLALRVGVDRREVEVGNPVRYSVELRRGDPQATGMVIVEAGLAPGVEVDRDSLDAVLRAGLARKHTVTPDRVLFYLWPNRQVTKFSFTVRPRLVMRAKTAPSLAYDYYNPDNRNVASPILITVTRPRELGEASAHDQ